MKGSEKLLVRAAAERAAPISADSVRSDVLAEHFGNGYAAVRILILLNESGENTACCKSGAVESVTILDSAAVITLEAYRAAACLIVTRV